MDIKWKTLNFYTKVLHSGEWGLIEKQTDQVVKRGKTEKQAINNSLLLLEEKGLKKTKKVILDTIQERKNKELLLSAKTKSTFFAYFGRPLTDFIQIMGYIYFNIIKFDEWLNTPPGISTKNYIKEKYGLKAALFIERLNKL